MRALLDTNILIHREAPVVLRQDIGVLFNWLDQLNYEKCVHPVSVEEINRHEDERVRKSFNAKIAAYRVFQAPANIAREVSTLFAGTDKTQNQENDTSILNEVFVGHADLLITEDRGVIYKAALLSIADRVFTIDSFLEKAVAENPALIDYNVLSVTKTLFGKVDVKDSFFDTFRADYEGFDGWSRRKSEEPAYLCMNGEDVAAFLYLKVEGPKEPYADIYPRFKPKRRLKIGTFKVELNGFKLGERFLKIVFDNAIKQRAEEIYVTIFEHSAEQERLIRLLEDYGFCAHGKKRNPYGEELVLVRDMAPRCDSENPKHTYPYISRSARTFLVPIYPKYHTELLPDSILNTESPDDFVEHEPHRNAIRKVYTSRSVVRDLRAGDVIVFYRTGGYYKSVVTTLGIVDNVHHDVTDEDHFIRLCRKRSVFSDEGLRQQWRWKPGIRPFIVEFLYTYSFPRRPNLATLIEHGVIRDKDSAPRGFERISREKFDSILALSNSDTRSIVD